MFSPVCRSSTRVAGRVSGALRSRVSPLSLQRRGYNFASHKYAACFGNLDKPNSAELRTATVELLDKFDTDLWYSDPIRTVLNGQIIRGGAEVITVNAFAEENGLMEHATEEVVDDVIAHMKSYKPPSKDLRSVFRVIEQELLSTDIAAQLVANQAMDFKKQDGITEIEESVEANTVERRLNDGLMAAEEAGRVAIQRNPALVGCVSNFSNFLDLFRKVLRNMELGVPVVVLSRSNTAQHCYRWFQILTDLMAKHDVDQGMCTHLACSIHQQRRVMKANPASPLYFTGSRPVSAAIKEVCPKLMASTGGPNTMVVAEWNDQVAEAARLSAVIENSGQCTAMRHLVGPSLTEQDIDATFADCARVVDSKEALAGSHFAAVFQKQDKTFSVDTSHGYLQQSSGLPMAYKVSTSLPSDEIDEKWRQCYVDVTALTPEDLASSILPPPSTTSSAPSTAELKPLDDVARWLVKHQPISLAVNAPTFEHAFRLAGRLFERSCMVVYTVGAEDKPGLTAQARPQDAEIFGEFPPRSQLTTYTRFPVVGPSSTPGYDTTYTSTYLRENAANDPPAGLSYIKPLIFACADFEMQGYLYLQLKYLNEACGSDTPRRAFGARTALWGLQRPPLDDSVSVIRCEANTRVDEFAPFVLPFVVTNARTQLRVSVHPENAAVRAVLDALEKKGVSVAVAVEESIGERGDEWNVVSLPKAGEFERCLVGHHTSLLFPLGHIKSTRGEDEEFISFFSASAKWLRLARE